VESGGDCPWHAFAFSIVIFLWVADSGSLMRRASGVVVNCILTSPDVQVIQVAIAPRQPFGIVAHGECEGLEMIIVV